jgi:hypothetical protein
MNKSLSLNGPVIEIIEREFQGIYSGELGLSSINGGQTAADHALEKLDITGYANRRDCSTKRLANGKITPMERSPTLP